MEIEAVSSLTKLKYLFFKRKRSTLLKENIFNDYVSLVKMQLKKCVNRADGEILLWKILKVCNTLQIQMELTGEDVKQYEFIAELLNFCFVLNIQDSELIISFLRISIAMCGMAPFVSLYVHQPSYPEGFLKYILKHARREKFDLGTYCWYHPRTLWKYSRNFSVLHAVSLGNEQRVLTLLQYGVEVFSERDLKRSVRGFPFIEEIPPLRYLMVLRMMQSMRSANLFLLNSTSRSSNRANIVTDNQKRCFQLLWRAIPYPYVKHGEIVSVIFDEYFVLPKHICLNSMKYKKNSKFCMMYEKCFKELASGPKEPRSLQHLSRCAIRKRLRELWNLPHGIFQLSLPKLLHHYLNLESD